MAGEIFIARQDTLENVQGTVNTIDTNVDTVNTTTTAIKDETESIKSDTEALKLSTETIDQIADTILERIGLTTDVGGVLQQEVSLLNLTLCSVLGAAA